MLVSTNNTIVYDFIIIGKAHVKCDILKSLGWWGVTLLGAKFYYSIKMMQCNVI